MKEKFYKTTIDEQETILTINYYEKEISLYTNRKAVYERIIKKIGQPTKQYYTDKKISGANWIISFENKKNITSILSRPTLIGNMK